MENNTVYFDIDHKKRLVVRFNYDQTLVEVMRNFKRSGYGAPGFINDENGPRWLFDSSIVSQLISESKKVADVIYSDKVEDIMEDRGIDLVELSASVGGNHLNGEYDRYVPDGLKLYDYQKVVLDYANSARYRGVLLGDEMGLGKTIEAIVISNMKKAQKILVVCPKSVTHNWQREFNIWLNRPLSVAIATSKEMPVADVTIINYEAIRAWIDYDKKKKVEIYSLGPFDQPYDILICDEIHRCKNNKSIIGQCLKAIAEKAEYRIGISGTPITNRPQDLWWPLNILDDSAWWGDWYKFHKEYCNLQRTRWGFQMPIPESGNGREQWLRKLKILNSRLRSSILIRRLKKDALPQLPEKIRLLVCLPKDENSRLIEENQRIWRELKRLLNHENFKSEVEYRRAVKKLRDGGGFPFARFMSIRHETALAKVPSVLSFIDDMRRDYPGKLVLFCHHQDVIDAYADSLNTELIIDGRTSSERRDKVQQYFQDCDDPEAVCIVGITAGGIGINLSSAQLGVMAELDLSPGNMMQAEDRLHRIGQEGLVSIYVPVWDGTIDSHIARMLINKQGGLVAALNYHELI